MTPVIEILQYHKIQISNTFLKLRVESHPDFPSLIAIQDTLEELGITAFACSGTKEELMTEAKPFLAHLNRGDGDIVFCKNVTEAERKIKDFDKVWSGNVIFIEKPERFGNPEHDAILEKEKRNSVFTSLSLLIPAILFISLPILTDNYFLLWLTVSCMAGLYLSWLIVQKEFGISNSVSDKICSMAKHSRCESVLHAKGAKLFNWLTWGDVGIIYFTASLLFISLLLLNNAPTPLYYLISVVGMVFPFYSLYYQWRVVKQWCMLCIGVLIVLTINAGLASTQLNSVNLFGLWKQVLAFILISSGILAVWQLLKYLYGKSQQALQHQINALQLKRNPQIFNALLQSQGINSINLPEQDEAIRFGNPAALYQLVIACNPYCTPCAKAHKAIEELYEQHTDKISVSVRFALAVNEEKDARVIAVKEIIKAAKTNPLEAVKDWYNIMNLEEFKKRQPTNGEQVDTHIEKHIMWAKEVGIIGTPTFFINGRKIPELYTWAEFIRVIEYELKQ